MLFLTIYRTLLYQANNFQQLRYPSFGAPIPAAASWTQRRSKRLIRDTNFFAAQSENGDLPAPDLQPPTHSGTLYSRKKSRNQPYIVKQLHSPARHLGEKLRG